MDTVNPLDLVLSVARNFSVGCEKPWQEETPDSLVFGEGGPLGSLDLIDFMLAVEYEVREKTGQSLKLYDTKLVLKGNPYKSLRSIAGLIEGLMEKPNNPTQGVRPPVKLIMCDLDGTLWKGVAGEEDIEHDREIQMILHKLYGDGVLLGLVTKNYREIVGEAFATADISLGFFLAQCYTTDNKPEAIKRVAKSLNIGIESVAFIDDDRIEIARMREELPAVRSLDSPVDIRGIETSPPTPEDRARTQMYKEEYRRRGTKSNYENQDKWLKSLGMELIVSEAKTGYQKERAGQLLRRANQFNFVKRDDYGPPPKNSEFVFSLVDKFGDSGIVAVVRVNGDTVTDFCVSCRVLGRGVEEGVMQWAAKRLGVTGFNFRQTLKNLAAVDFVTRYMGKIEEINKAEVPIRVRDICTSIISE